MKTLVRAAFTVALLPMLALAASAQVPAASKTRSNPLFASPTHLDRVGRIVVPVMIDGKGPFRFLVDTGADGSMISPALVRTLGLVPSPTGIERVEGTTGTEKLRWVSIDSLRIGAIVKHDVHMPISHTPVLIGLDGILGLAGFGAVRVSVDFRSNRVVIDRSTADLPRGYLDIRARRTPGGLLMIPARVGNIRVEAVIDTGAAETLGNASLRRALLRDARNPAGATIYGVTRQVSSGGISASPTIFLGPAAIRGLAIVYSDIPIFGIWHLNSRPAVIIGMNVLGSVDALVLDYSRARVYMRPTARKGLSSAGIDDVFFPDPGFNDGGG
jgi:predicted aspartyl protease